MPTVHANGNVEYDSVEELLGKGGARDPLQGAADWLKEGLVDCTVTDIQQRLLIGHNRAKRLMDAAKPAKPKPLGDSKIRERWEATFSTSNPFCPCDLKSFTKAVRATEAAHGILD